METAQETNMIENHLNSQANQDRQHVEQIATNVNGTVKWFNRIKGYGFITRDDTKEDIFVHFSGVKPEIVKNNRKQTKKRLNLFDQEKVLFDIVKAGNVLEARNVVGKNGYLLIDQIAFKRGISPLNNQIINDGRLSGKVKWFNVQNRYGYIQCDYNNEDIYVNSSSIIKNNPNKYKASLADGELVEFDILKRQNGRLEAVNVTGPNGEHVTGSDYSPDKVDKTKQNCVEQNVQGKVKWFNLKAGFGYITRNDNGQDVYVHYTSVTNKNPNHRLRSLGDGELVTFNIVDGAKGQEATDVTGPNGQHVLGSEYARPSSNRRRRNQSPIGRPMGRGGLRGRGGRLGRNNSPMNGRRPPRQQRSTSGPRRNPPMDRMGDRRPRRGPPMNVRNNYAPNLYNSNNYYDNNEPLYYTFKPKNKLPYDSNGPRRMPYDRYENLVNRPPVGKPRGRRPPLPSRNNYQQQDNSNNTSVVILERVQGFCKWFNYVRGFGYVTRYDNREDIYVHRSAIQRTQQGNIMPSLDEGEPVEFDICKDPMNNMMAVNVTGPNNSPLKGSRYANVSAPKQQQQQQERSPLQTKVYRRRRMVN